MTKNVVPFTMGCENNGLRPVRKTYSSPGTSGAMVRKASKCIGPLGSRHDCATPWLCVAAGKG